MNLAALRIVRHAMASGLADYSVTFTWRTWLGAWVSRVLVQVAFFAMIGIVLDDPAHTRYLLIGIAVFVVAVETAGAIAATTWERHAGTLPLLLASPANPTLVFFGRTLFSVGAGVITASLALFLLSPIFGVHLPLTGALVAVPLVALTALASYCLMLACGGLALRFPHLHNLISNVLLYMLMVFCGPLVPVSFWPEWVRTGAGLVPFTHGLEAVRAAFDGAPAGMVLGQAGWAALTGAAWLAVAALTFRRLADRGRRDGSVEFTE